MGYAWSDMDLDDTEDMTDVCRSDPPRIARFAKYGQVEENSEARPSAIPRTDATSETHSGEVHVHVHVMDDASPVQALFDYRWVSARKDILSLITVAFILAASLQARELRAILQLFSFHCYKFLSRI